MVAASPEIAYNEARKKLKSRFGRPAIIATDFENKLANWPKIANNDAQAFREYSDFLQQVEIGKTHLHSLKIFEFPSKLKTLVDKLPNRFLTKWSTKVQSLQQERGREAFPTFAEFVAEVTFHADRMNIPQIYQNSPKVSAQSTRSKLPPPDPPLRRKMPFSITMASKTCGESEPSHPAPIRPEHKSSVSSPPTANKFCLFHRTKTHMLNECNELNECFENFLSPIGKTFLRKNKLCFKCMSTGKHSAEHCDQAPPDCNICHKRHLTALHIAPMLESKAELSIFEPNQTSTACTQVCGEEETGRLCARIVLVTASHRSNPAKN